ncbi:MAG: DNA polymerase/3'-5' exonuclease PolX [Opitutales bacterium]
MDKADIADVLEEIAALLEIKGENAFKVRAYQNGARAIETLEEDLGTLLEEDRLGEVQGIGKALVDKVRTLHEDGELAYYDDLKASVPEGLLELLEVPGLGPKKVKKVYEELGVSDLDALRVACEDGRVAELKGLGKKTAESILKGIENLEAYSARHLWWDAFEVAEPILEGLRELDDVEMAEHAGSLRRRVETVGDLDFLVAAAKPAPVMDWFCGREGVEEVLAKGETKSSVRYEGGLQADLRVVPKAQFFSALHHFTGSKNHNVRMRSRALERGLSLSEWGLFPKDERGNEQREDAEPVQSEAELFERLGLRYIPPELREDTGEIEAAELAGGEGLPELIQWGDLQGVFHNHTTASDGRATLEDMVQAAQDRGYAYFGLADHSKASFQANGLDEERLEQQLDAVQALNDSGKFETWCFSGIECDILKDGSLDLDDAVLERCDYVVVSVHASMSGMSEEAMTKRICKALEHPQATMLGHLTGRLLLRREGYAVNAAKVIDCAAGNGKLIELNANPYRLDMDWRHWRRARDKGVLCCINPDAHAPDQLDLTRAGLQVARKGWLRKEDVLNTRSLKDVKAYLGVD